jgi:hypothetical protein
MTKTPRNEIKELLSSAILQELLPYITDEQDARAFQGVIHARTEEVLQKFEKSMLIHEVRNIIVNDCKEALTKMSRRERWIEYSFVITTILIGIILTVLTIELQDFRWLAGSAFVLCVIQVGLYGLWKLFH